LTRAHRATAEPEPGRGPRIAPAILAGLLLLSLALRLPNLPRRQMVEGDGVHYATLARSILIGDLSGLANPYWSNLWPGVIAATSFATGLDVVAAGRLASLVAGAALTVFTAMLGARLFSPLVGILAGLGVAVHPWLVQFSTVVFTESFFSLLLVATLLLGWSAIGSPSPTRGAALGAVVGAALMTRPETHGAAFVIALFLLGRGWKAGEMRRAYGPLAVAALVAALFVGARALIVHHYFHDWDFGQSKGTANLILGMEDQKERAFSGLTADGENRLAAQMREWSMLRLLWTYPGRVLQHTGRNFLELGGCAFRVFPPLPVTMGREAFRGTPLWRALDLTATACMAVAGLALLQGLRTRDTRGAAAFLGATLAVYFVGLAPLYVHERMIVAVTPVFLILMGQGMVVVGTAVAGFRLRPLGYALLFLPAALLSLAGLLRSRNFDYVSEPLVQKEAGLWLRERFSQELRLTAVSPSIPFYFYDAQHQSNAIDFPWVEYGPFMAYARKEQVDLVAASEWQLEAAGFPTAPNLLPAGDHPGLRYVGTVGEESHRVHVFRLEPSPESPARADP